jgi:hypothetical protein
MAHGNFGVILVAEGEALDSSAEWFTGLDGARVTLPQQFRLELARIDPVLSSGVAKHSPQLAFGNFYILESMSHDA